MKWSRLVAPWLELAEERRRTSTLSTALSNANTKIVELQAKLGALEAQECDTCAVLKQQVNHLILASGSRVKMFDGYGPTIPVTPVVESKPINPIRMSARASHVARSAREDFLSKFAAETGEPIPFVFPEEPVVEPVAEVNA